MDNQLSKKGVQDEVERLKAMFGGAMSEEEVQFLRDVQGFIEFCVRNGLSFPVVVTTIGHDINGLAKNGFALTSDDGFLPKVTGYAKLNAADIGDPETDE